jgi:hypothetical protein
VRICHSTSNEGHWVRIEVDKNSARVEGHKNHGRHWNVDVTDFYPSAWQVANKTCGPKPPPRSEWKPRASLSLACFDRTTAIVTYQYTTDDRRMGLTRSVTGRVFPASIQTVNTGKGTKTETYKVALGNDGKRWVRAKFVLSSDDVRIVRQKGRLVECGGIPPGRGGGDLIGPKGDPWYRGVAWYRGERKAKAVLRDNGSVVFKRRFGDGNPDTRCVFKSGWRYILPNHRLVYTVREMGTNKVLYREVVDDTPAGNFGALYKGFTPGTVTCR